MSLLKEGQKKKHPFETVLQEINTLILSQKLHYSAFVFLA